MDTVLRVVVVYVAILAGLRVLGKRDVGELSPLELITLILVPDLVSQGVVGDDFSLTNSLVAIATLFCLVFLISLCSHRFKKIETMIDGEPTLLVAKGRLLTKNLNRERIAPEEIYSEMHKAGLDKLSSVRWAVLETDGRIAIVPESAP